MRISSTRAPLPLSTLDPGHVDLTDPERRQLRCPDCGTWQYIRRGAVQAHRAAPAPRSAAAPVRRPPCTGARRTVICDITPAAWRAAAREAAPLVLPLSEQFDGVPAEARRVTRVKRLGTSPAPAVTQMRHVPVGADAARAVYRAHVRACATCTGRDRCPLGTRLARTVDIAQGRARIDRRYAAAMAGQRAAAWTRQYEATADATQHAKRSGTAVEEANNQCKRPPTGASSGYRGPALPLLAERLS